MSATEEAREQAREALELIHTWAQREQAWDTPRALDFARIGASIRALLDATEPPAPLSVEDFITGTTDGEVDTDEFFADRDERPAEPMRDADGDMISSGEHRKISMSGDSFFVCDTCTNVLGLNVRWDHASKREDHQAAVESLLVKPAEDESEALVALLESPQHAPMNTHNGADGSCMDCPWPLHMLPPGDVADGLLAAGYSKGPRPITDERVRAALNAYFGCDFYADYPASVPDHEPNMRRALEAAEEARR